MKKAFKITSYAILAVFCALALSGCGKKQTTTDPNANKLTIWSFEDEDVWKPIIKSIESKNAGYSVTYKKQVFDAGYENRVLNSILSAGTPDIWAMPNDWVYRHKDKLYPATTAAMEGLDLSKRFVPSIKESVVIDKKVYALAPSSEPLMVYYNPKLLENASKEAVAAAKDQASKKRVDQLLSDIPKTWSDFSEAIKYLTKKNGDRIEQAGAALGTANVSNSQDILYLLMKQNETDMLSKDGKLATFNLPKSTTVGTDDLPGKRALEFYTSFANADSPNYTWNDALGNDVDAFANGKVVMIFGYSSLQNDLLQKYPNFKYKKGFVPQVSDGEDKIVDYATFTAYGVSKYSKNPGIAWSAIRTLATDKASDYSSATKRHTAELASKYDISLKARSSSNPEKLELATAHIIVKGKNPDVFDKYIRDSISAVNAKTLNAQNAIDLAASKITELLRTNEWL